MDDKHFVGLELKVQGHLRIFEYPDRESLKQGKHSRILLNRRNAIHKDNASIMAVKALTNRSDGQIAYMFFGNGGTTVDDTGTVIFNPPNDIDTNGDLYNPVYYQLVDDTLGALAGNTMSVRHISGSYFSDIEIRCLVVTNQPFGQLGINTLPTIVEPTTILNINNSQFAFDEIGLKLADGTLVTHVIFVPIVKTASSLLEIVYTIRIALQAPIYVGPPVTLHSEGLEATTEIGTFDFNQRVQALRLNRSPYLAQIPTSITDSPVGTLSLWVRATDLFNTVHDISPALLSSGFRRTLDISGRGYVRRNPLAISRTDPCVVTIPDHGLSDGNTVQFTHVDGGCSELQGFTETITVIDDDNFSVAIDATGFAADYTGPAQVTFINVERDIPNTVRIIFRDDDIHPTTQYYWNSSEQIPLDQWVNLLISWDMNHPSGSKVLQFYIGETAWTSTTDPTYVYDPGDAFNIQYSSTPKWVIGTPIVAQTFVKIPQIAREVLRSRT